MATKYFAARPFSDGNHTYGMGAPVPLRKRGEGPECGIRESQVANLLRTGLITEDFHAPVEQLSAETTARTEAAKKAEEEAAKKAEEEAAKKAESENETPAKKPAAKGSKSGGK